MKKQFIRQDGDRISPLLHYVLPAAGRTEFIKFVTDVHAPAFPNGITPVVLGDTVFFAYSDTVKELPMGGFA